jgi:single-strand DNA-binding protein
MRASFRIFAKAAFNRIFVSHRSSQTTPATRKHRLAAQPLKGVDMNSFTLTAIGNLAKDPELAVKGDTTYTQICLIGNDYAGKDESGNAREAVTSLWFVAFENLGEAIAKYARKGDQLMLQAQVRADNWTDKEGKKHYDHSFVVQNFRFGAPGKMKREQMAARRDESEIGALETEI